MTTIYIIGPSGAGKSTLSQTLAKNNDNIICIDLDDTVKQKANYDSVSRLLTDVGTEHFWAYCYQELMDIEVQLSPSEVYLVDVGAGAFETPVGRQFFISHCKHVICIWAELEAVYERKHKKYGRSKHHLMEIEYSPNRMAMYDAATCKIDTTNLSIETSLDTFQKAVFTLIP